MSGFFAILRLTLLITGAVSVHETVQVKRGNKLVLFENKSGSEKISLLKLDLYKASADCKPLYPEILKYCSPKEQTYGCLNKNGSTFLLEIEKNGVSLTPLLNASDGCYVASYIFSNNSIDEKVFEVNGELPRTVSTDPPSTENPDDNSTKGRETPGTDDPPGITWDIWVGIIGVGITVCIGVCILAWWCLKKKKNRDCKKNRNISFRNGNIEAGEQTPDDSFETEDRIFPAEDEDNLSLNQVLISDDASAGQENGRPGRHMQNDIYSDDDDDDSKLNNTNNNRDSDFWSSDEDGDDDEIKSNNTNNYVNDNNNNDGVANGGDDDDDGIASGDNSSNV